MKSDPPVVLIKIQTGIARGLLLDGGFVLSAQHVLQKRLLKDLEATGLQNEKYVVPAGPAVVAGQSYAGNADLAVARLAEPAAGVVRLAGTKAAALAGTHTLHLVRGGALVPKPIHLTAPSAFLGDPPWSHDVDDTEDGDSGSPIFRHDGVLAAVHIGPNLAWSVHYIADAIEEMDKKSEVGAAAATQAENNWVWVKA
jgi:hypothetical protein